MKSPLDEDEGGFDSFVRKLKQVIFDVLAILEQEDEEDSDSMLLFYVQTAADYVQMHSFPFNEKVDQVWKASSFLQIIFTIFNVLSISNYLPSINYLTFIISVYFLLLVILLMILDIIYVSYSFSRKRFAVMWPLHVLRRGVSLVVTVFFLPITETLISLITCSTNENGEYAMELFPDVVCWQGWHILHSILACLFNLIFTIICSIVAYAFFEPRMGSKNRTARSDSNGEVVFILNKVICQVLYSFLSAENAWILTIMTFILSCWLFKAYNIDDPYYDWEVSLFYNIISTYYLWTCGWLMVCKVVENTSFSGGLIAWLLGLPFIISIMISTKQSKIDMLLRSQNKFKSGEDINNHIRYVLQLIKNQQSDKNSNMLLMGYIEKHKETCAKLDECQLLEKNNKKIASNRMEHILDALLIELDKLFQQGLEKFPQSTQLRISYAFFLIDRKSNSQKKALMQFQDAQKYGFPSFDQEFIIYKNSKSIKNNNKESQDENNDVIKMIEFENHMDQCDEMMRISANLHKEFWIELKEDQPDLRKLNTLGQRITKATGLVKESYNKMQKINPEIYFSIRVYGLFLFYVLNNKQEGKDKLKLAVQKREKQKQNWSQGNEFLLENDVLPVITVNMAKKNGVIVGMNQLVVNLLGYSKQELVGKPVSNLMPLLYAQYHNHYLQLFWEAIKAGEYDSNYVNKEQVNYFKHKSGCIIPVQYKVMINLELYQYYVQIKAVATEKYLIHLILDKNTKVQEFSSLAISVFGLDQRLINTQDIFFKQIIPDILISTQKDFIFKAFFKSEERVYYFRKEVKQLSVKIITELLEDNGYQNDHYAVVLEMIEKSEAVIPIKRSLRPSVDLQLINPNYQLAGLSTSSVFFNQLTMPANPNNTNNNQLMIDFWATPRQEEIDQILSYTQREERTLVLHEVQIDSDIKTRRLINNQIVPIDEEQQELFEKELEEQEKEDSVFKNKNDYQVNQDEYKAFAKQKQQITIVNALNANHKHATIQKMKLYAFLYVLFSCIVSIIWYEYVSSFTEDQTELLESSYLSNQIGTKMQFIITKTIDHMFVGPGLSQFDHQQLYDDTLVYIQSINEDLVKFQKRGQYFHYISDDKVLYREYIVANPQNPPVNVTVGECIYRIISNVIPWLTHDLEKLEELGEGEDEHEHENEHEHEDVEALQGFLKNVLNNYYPQLEEKFEEMSWELLRIGYAESLGFNYSHYILMSVCILVGLFTLVYFIAIMIRIKTQRENIMFLFLAIPEGHLKNFQRSCEKFIKQSISIKGLIEKQNEYDMSSDEEDFEQDESFELEEEEKDIEHLRKQSQRYKKVLHKYQANTFLGAIGTVITTLVLILTTFSNTTYQLYTIHDLKQFINLVWPQYQAYQQFIQLYTKHLNNYQLMMFDSEQIVANESIVDITAISIQGFRNNQEKLREFSVKVFDEFEEFAGIYNTVQYFLVCDPVKEELGEEEFEKCTTYFNTTINLGTITLEQYMYQYFHRQQQQYLNLTEPIKLNPNVSDPLLYEINYALTSFLQYSWDHMIQVELDLVKDRFSKSINISLLLTVIYILTILFAYFAIVHSQLERLNKEANQTIHMLNMIPIEVIKQNKNLREFVIKLIQMMDQQLYY